MFQDREEAAHLLALRLLPKIKTKKAVVIALPRGAVKMGKIISEFLSVPLDILVLRKLGAPNNKELAIGVIGPDKTVFFNEDIIQSLGLKSPEIKKIESEKEKERKSLEKKFRAGSKPISVKDKTAIVIDDGVATGATVLGAEKYIRQKGAKKVVLAVPVIAKDTFRIVKSHFDTVIALKKPLFFYAVGQFYKDFPQVSDQEVIDLLK